MRNLRTYWKIKMLAFASIIQAAQTVPQFTWL
jgi:hypothetical protein